MEQSTWNNYEDYLAAKERAWALLLKQFREDDPNQRMTPDQIREYVEQFKEDWFAK